MWYIDRIVGDLIVGFGVRIKGRHATRSGDDLHAPAAYHLL
jgi:hypothetical protein